MAENNYAKGARLERWIVREFEDRGYGGIRSAGSRGPVDVIVYNGKTWISIQCKVRRKNLLYISERQHQRFIDYSKNRLGSIPLYAWKPSHTTKPAMNGFRGNTIFIRPSSLRKSGLRYSIRLKDALKRGLSIDDVMKIVKRPKTLSLLAIT